MSTYPWVSLALVAVLPQPEQTKPTVKPDLTVELVQGGTCYTASKFRIKNVGDGKAAASMVQVRADGVVLRSVKLGELDPGDQSPTYTISSYDVSAITEKPWIVVAIADATAALDERNEVNNQRGIAFCGP